MKKVIVSGKEKNKKKTPKLNQVQCINLFSSITIIPHKLRVYNNFIFVIFTKEPSIEDKRGLSYAATGQTTERDSHQTQI